MKTIINASYRLIETSKVTSKNEGRLISVPFGSLVGPCL